MPPFLEAERLTRRFAGAEAAVDGVSFRVEKGKVLALLGPSGSGKTTTLRLVAGFEEADGGRLLVDGVEETRTPPPRRRFGMVFQHYALFPHLDVAGNVAFGLEAQRRPAAEVVRRVAEALALVSLDGLAGRRVDELSGGQQQRVALARALAPEPRLLLLDEPLSNLDPTLREKTRAELAALVRRVGLTTILVTHEQEEAFELADEIVLLRRGRVEQTGPPEELYEHPANRFVAGFVGRASELAVRVVSTGPDGGAGQVAISIGEATWQLPGRAGAGLEPGAAAVLVARPEALGFATPVAGLLAGRVVRRRFAGSRTLFAVELADGAGTVEVSAESAAASIGDRVGIVPSADRRGLHLFAAGQSDQP